jgi:hypothetical protein
MTGKEEQCCSRHQSRPSPRERCGEPLRRCRVQRLQAKCALRFAESLVASENIVRYLDATGAPTVRRSTPRLPQLIVALVPSMLSLDSHPPTVSSELAAALRDGRVACRDRGGCEMLSRATRRRGE